MKLSIRDLEYLIAVGETKSFSKAAEKCFVSQPTLSHQLKKLESYYNIQLFERHPKKVIITQTGEKLIKSAKAILLQCQNFDDLAKSITSPLSGKFTLALIPTIGPYLLPKLMPKLKSEFPDLSCYFEESKTHKCITDLISGRIDACLLAYPLSKENTNSQFTDIKLFFEPFYLACHTNHELTKYNKISPDLLKSQQLMLLADGHCLSEHSISTCKLSDSQHNDNINIFRATSLETLRAMISLGSYVTIMPKEACIAYKNLTYIPFDNADIGRSVRLCFRKGDPRDRLMHALANYIKGQV